MRNVAQFLVAALVSQWPIQAAHAWGPDGHWIIGAAAQRLLCDAAAAEVAGLSGGESLGRIGQWADEIRSQPDWRHAAPWHYVNIADDGDPRRPPESPEGNVIVAIERFSSSLIDPAATPAEREVALRFLVHFVGDIHQPLHVGRAEDRGGNRIDVFYADVRGNLHAFWDTGVLRLEPRTPAAYALAIAAQVEATVPLERGTSVRDWAAQAFELRADVYDFDRATGLLDDEYLATASRHTEQQIVLAAAHLANALNDAFCR